MLPSPCFTADTLNPYCIWPWNFPPEGFFFVHHLGTKFVFTIEDVRCLIILPQIKISQKKPLKAQYCPDIHVHHECMEPFDCTFTHTVHLLCWVNTDTNLDLDYIYNLVPKPVCKDSIVFFPHFLVHCRRSVTEFRSLQEDSNVWTERRLVTSQLMVPVFNSIELGWVYYSILIKIISHV